MHEFLSYNPGMLPCPWRILNCAEIQGIGVGRIAPARSRHPSSPPDHNNVKARSACRRARRHSRIGSCQTSLILNRSRRRVPNLLPLDRLITAARSLWITPNRFRRVAIALKPSTLLSFHRALVKRKYRLLFSKAKTKPGPKGPTPELIRAVVEMKQHNPPWRCHRY